MTEPTNKSRTDKGWPGTVGSPSSVSRGNLPRRQRGALLLETVAAVFVFGLVGTAVLTGLSTTAMTGQALDVQANVENIARNQMERMFTLPYQDPGTSYATLDVPEGYAVTCVAEEFDAGNPNISRVVVTVTANGTPRIEISTLRTR